jgi:DNA-binding CsgD family transcriptional regulator
VLHYGRAVARQARLALTVGKRGLLLMKMIERSDPQMTALAGLLRRAYRAGTEAELAAVITGHVRESLSARLRDPLRMDHVRAALERAIGQVQQAPPARGARVPWQSVLHEALQEAASMLAGVPEARDGGRVLLAAADGIADAARLLSERRRAAFQMTMIRDLELLGAPPAAAVQVDGGWTWTNTALQELIELRSLDAKALLEACHARAVLAAAPAETASGKDSIPAQMRKAGLYLHATVHRSSAAPGDCIVVVSVLERPAAEGLSRAELAVAREVCKARGCTQAARNLGMSVDGVRRHVRRAYRKLGVRNRAALKARMLRDGLLEASTADARDTSNSRGLTG